MRIFSNDSGCGMLRLREALEASWSREISYGSVEHAGNPAFGQCYPTSRAVQHYYPATEIIKGTVWTGRSEGVHFWNGLPVGGCFYHIDLSWQQFPPGSVVRGFAMLDRDSLNDSEATLHRCALLLRRVEHHLGRPHHTLIAATAQDPRRVPNLQSRPDGGKANVDGGLGWRALEDSNLRPAD